jgi:23S rRNA (cytidine1920-2'-O)/16S rRNA (cytidine1409-2'-O)-methyltransferase
VPRRRLDAELIRRGLVQTRDEAEALVLSGKVLVAGAPATKAATLVRTDAALAVQPTPRPFVSRAGGKLEAALDRFEIDPAGLACLDAGASSGGFTHCLLRRGAASVVAVDVGYGQLDWSLRNDPRVLVRERTNVRDLAPGSLRPAPVVVVADVSFVSLRGLLPTLAGVAAPGATFVLLVKPQFEVDAADVGAGGVVRDVAAWRGAVEGVVLAARSAGLGLRGVIASPLPGPAGNVEFLVSGVLGGSDVDLGADLEAALIEGEALR